MEKGYELQFSFSKELVDNTDAFADCVIDGVYRGGNCFLQATSKEYKSSVLAGAIPYNLQAFTSTGANVLGPGIIGRLDSNIAGAIVMTATAGTPAASAPASLTISFAIIAENFDIRWMFAPEHRRIPLRFRILPYSNSGIITWFTTT